MSIKPIIQQITAKQQALEQGVKQMQTEKMRGIEAKADAFLTASDPIGFIGKLASEAPDEIAPVVNAARRKKKEVMQAQVPQQENVTTAGMREVLTPEPQQPPPNPRQMAIAGLPINPNMFRKAGGGIVAFQNKGFVDALNRQFETANPYMVPFEKSGSFKDFYRDMFGVPRYKGKQDINRDPSMLRQIAPFLTSEELDKELIEEERSAGFRKTDQQELDRRIAEQDSRDSFRDQRVFEPEVKKEVEEKRQTIVPETATEAAIGEAEVDTKPMSVEDAFAQAEKLLKPVNISQNGAIGSGVEAPVDFSQKAESILKKAGVNFSDSAATAAIKSEKAALAGDKKEAVYMSLLELGFAIMGGTDPNALTNIGKAGMQVAPALAKRIQATKDARRRVTDAEIKLEEIRNKRAEGIAGISAKLQMNAENNVAAAERDFLRVKGTLAASFLNNDRARDVAKIKANKLGSAAEVIQLLKKPGETDSEATQRYLELSKAPDATKRLLDAIQNKDSGDSGGSFTPDPEKDAYLKKYLSD